MIFDPIDRTWIFWGVQPSVHSETASSAIFYLWKMTFLFLKLPGFYLLQDGYIYIHIYKYVDMYI